jgi:hypothetical protein
MSSLVSPRDDSRLGKFTKSGSRRRSIRKWQVDELLKRRATGGLLSFQELHLLSFQELHFFGE